MNHRLLIVLAIGSALAAFTGCHATEISVPPDKVKLSWDSPRIAELEEEASRRTPSTPKPGMKGRSTVEIRALLDVMEERLTPEQWRQLARSLATMRYEANRHAPYLVECMITHHFNRQERKELVELLSHYCPKELDGHRDIEMEVAEITWTDTPLLILRDAFLESRRPETRKAIADAFRRAFVGVDIATDNDALMVSKGTDWYLQNRDKVIVNPDYSDSAWEMVMRMPGEEMTEYGRRPLFVSKR